MTRRDFLTLTLKSGFAATSSALWLSACGPQALAQANGSYKAVVLITLFGGNDGNNMLIPLDSAEYQEYAAIRPAIALSEASCLPLTTDMSGKTYGLHPSMPNVAALYNSDKALVVANVGPLRTPANKAQLIASPDLVPAALLGHQPGIAQWESANTVEFPATGWGGRMADAMASESGSLPPILNAGPASIFTVGNAVQAIVVQSGTSAVFTALPVGMQDVLSSIAEDDAKSQNNLIAECAKLRVQALNQQIMINQAQISGGTLKTVFPNTTLGQALQAIVEVINGRSVIGASRQIFYTQQGGYDTHGGQPVLQASCLADLDSSLGAFMQGLQEIGMANNVIVCTHSDFNRTFVANGSQGTDHAWGNHQLILGGGIRGGRIIGTMPDLELGGSSDFNTSGTWIPTLSVTQMTAGIGAWMGLNTVQLASIFPDLSNFSQGAISLS